MRFIILSSFLFLSTLSMNINAANVTQMSKDDIQQDTRPIYGNTSWYYKRAEYEYSKTDENELGDVTLLMPGPNYKHTVTCNEMITYYNDEIQKALEEGNHARLENLAQKMVAYFCGGTPTKINKDRAPTEKEIQTIVEGMFWLAKAISETVLGLNRDFIFEDDIVRAQTAEAFFQNLIEKCINSLPPEKQASSHASFLMFGAIAANQYIKNAGAIDFNDLEDNVHQIFLGIYDSCMHALEEDPKSEQNLLRYTLPYINLESRETHHELLSKAVTAIRRLSEDKLRDLLVNVSYDFQPKVLSTIFQEKLKGGKKRKIFRDVVHDVYFTPEETSGRSNYCYFNMMRQTKARESYPANIDFPERISQLEGEQRKLAKKIIGESLINKLLARKPSREMNAQRYADMNNVFKAGQKIKKEFGHNPHFQKLYSFLIERLLLNGRSDINKNDQTYGHRNTTIEHLFQWLKNDPSLDPRNAPIKIKRDANEILGIRAHDSTHPLKDRPDDIQSYYRPIIEYLQDVIDINETFSGADVTVEDGTAILADQVIDEFDELTQVNPETFQERLQELNNLIQENLDAFLDSTELKKKRPEAKEARRRKAIGREEDTYEEVSLLAEIARTELETANMQTAPNINNLAGLFAILDQKNVVIFNKQDLDQYEVHTFIIDPSWETVYGHLSTNHYTRLRPIPEEMVNP